MEVINTLFGHNVGHNDSISMETQPDLVINGSHFIHCLKIKGTHISFGWMPSYVGLYGNDPADRTARQGALHSVKSHNVCVHPSVKEAFISDNLSKTNFKNIEI